MANWYVSSASYTSVAQWAASHAYTVGQIVRQLATPAVGSERCFRCSTAGTSAGTEPSWTLTAGGLTSDGSTLKWTECTGNETYQGSGGTWAAPHARLENVNGWAGSNDKVFISSTHYQTQSSNWTPALPQYVISVGETHVPPQSSDLAAGAVIEVSGASNIAPTYTGYFLEGYQYGITYRAGVSDTSSTTSTVQCIGQAHTTTQLEKCSFEHVGTSGTVTSTIQFASTYYLYLKNCAFKFGHANDQVVFNCPNCSVESDGSSTTVYGTIIPNVMFNVVAAQALFSGLDLSNINTTICTSNGSYSAMNATFQNCRLNASATLAPATFTEPWQSVSYIDCNSSATPRDERYTYTGNTVTETTVVKTGGAQIGSTPVSWRMTSGGGAAFNNETDTPPMAVWNTTVGSTVNVNIDGIANPYYWSAIPKTSELALFTSFPSNASYPLRSQVYDTNLFDTGTSRTASTAAWDGVASARANTTAYGFGAVIKIASNPSRLFFCTVAGTSAASEPGGFATAVDGGSVTDGGATFKAGWRFTMTIAVSPQAAGYITAKVKLLKASAQGVYIDPNIRLS